MNSAEFRNATRRDLGGAFEVIDSMTGLRVGHLIDLSGSGLQVATTMPLVQDALYQWRFPLPAQDNAPPQEIECGIHVLWISSEMPGEYAAGGRFIQISQEASRHIRAWCEGGHFGSPR